jgi:hypothetical protein
MPNPFADPAVFFTNGIPISPADLNIQGVSSKDQINRLSAFSQLVNDIPAPNSKVWLPDGTKVWDIYELLLTLAQFPDNLSEPDRAIAAFASAASLHGVSGSAPAIPQDFALNWNDAAAGIGSTLRSAGFQLKSHPVAPEPSRSPTLRPQAAMANAMPQAAMANANQPGPGLAAMFQNLQAKLASATLTDLVLGTQFCPTVFYPMDFYQSAYESYWQPFELTPQTGDVWVPVPAGGKITGEMITVQLQRSWWSTWVFSNRAWRFSPDSGMQPISDGASPPSGSMPLFPSALLIARNVKTVLPQGPSAAAAAVESNAPSFAPFKLISPPAAPQGNGPSAAPMMQAEPAAADSAPPMMIFAFVCTPIGLCPNPDPSLNWPS